MDAIFIYMDNLFKHLGPLKRQYTYQPPIQSVACLSKKTKWIDGTFRTTNFSFILSGSGKYTCIDGTWEVKAPCVLTQWPVDPFYYGPCSEWKEFYVCFPGESYQQFLDSGLMSTNRRIWPIANIRRFMNALQEFKNKLDEEQSAGWVDRLDLAAQNIITESLLGEADAQDEKERRISIVRNKIEMNYLDDHDFDEIALDIGMSPSSFRRHWGKFVNVPPRKYVIQLRISRAQRYLIETQLPIAEIASKVKFDDQFYFARKFRQFIGMTPSEYRENNKIPCTGTAVP